MNLAAKLFSRHLTRASHNWVTLGQLFAMLTSVATVLITSRLLDTAGRGFLATFQNTSTLAATIGSIGTIALVMRHQRYTYRRRRVRVICAIALCSTILLAAILSFAVSAGNADLDALLTVTLISTAAASILGIEWILANLQGRENLRAFGTVRAVSAALVMGAAVITSYYAAWQGVVLAVTAANVVVLVCTIAVLVVDRRSLRSGRRTPAHRPLVADDTARQQVPRLATLLKGHACIALLILTYRGYIPLLAALGKPEFVAVAAVAVMITELNWLDTNSRGVRLAPQVLGLPEHLVHEKIRSESKAAFKTACALLPFAVGAGFLAAHLLREDFRVVPILVLILLGCSLTMIPTKLQLAQAIAALDATRFIAPLSLAAAIQACLIFWSATTDSLYNVALAIGAGYMLAALFSQLTSRRDRRPAKRHLKEGNSRAPSR